MTWPLAMQGETDATMARVRKAQLRAKRVRDRDSASGSEAEAAEVAAAAEWSEHVDEATGCACLPRALAALCPALMRPCLRGAAPWRSCTCRRGLWRSIRHATCSPSKKI